MKSLACKCLQLQLVPAFSWICAALGFALMAGRLCAGDSTTVRDSPSSLQTTWLEYRETKQPLINWPLILNPQPNPFTKEPVTTGHKVFRGRLQVGSVGTPFVFYLWDYTQGKLYLDLNGNLDLTDDPTGVFTSQRAKFSSYYQVFTNVHLSLKTPAGKWPLLLDLTLYQSTYNQVSGSAACRSFWGSQITLQNQQWQIGLVDNLPNESSPAEGTFLLLRPWAAREQPFDTQNGSLDAFRFCPTLFFQKQAYAVEYTFHQQNGTPKYKLSLREKAVGSGDLNLTGKFIQRLILTGNSTKSAGDRLTVVLDAPEGTVKIPTGTYGAPQMQLTAGGVEAFREVLPFGPARTELTIAADGIAVLKAGGPLTNAVSVSRRGAFLTLNYQLLGADGSACQLVHLDRTQPPRFNIYKTGKLIQSGKFEFG